MLNLQRVRGSTLKSLENTACLCTTAHLKNKMDFLRLFMLIQPCKCFYSCEILNIWASISSTRNTKNRGGGGGGNKGYLLGLMVLWRTFNIHRTYSTSLVLWPSRNKLHHNGNKSQHNGNKPQHNIKNMPHHNGNKLQHTKNISIAQWKQVATKQN